MFFYCNIHKTNWTSCKDVWLEIGLDGLILLISDIDECALGTHNCPNGYECLNIEGSFRCRQPTCQRGTRFSGATGRCEPINCPRGREADSLGMCVGVYLYWSIHSIHNHPYYLIYCSINWLQRFFDFFLMSVYLLFPWITRLTLSSILIGKFYFDLKWYFYVNESTVQCHVFRRINI